MVRRILVLLLVIVLVVSCIYAYKNYLTRERMDDGAVHCTGCLTPEQETAFKRENAGESIDGQSEHKIFQPGIEQDRHPNGEGSVYDSSANQPRQESSYPTAPAYDANRYPEKPNYSDTNRPDLSRNPARPYYPPAQGYPPPSYTGDTIPPNPPNGMAFTGRGIYQWYREGNLTWRLNTETGSSCVAYATLEEWRKPLVMRNGCGSRG